MSDLERKFTAEDVKQIAGLTYRQLNVWENQAALPVVRDKKNASGWRRYSAAELLVILACVQLRDAYGVSVQLIARLQKQLKGDAAFRGVGFLEECPEVILTNLGDYYFVGSCADALDELAQRCEHADQAPHTVMVLLGPLAKKISKYQRELRTKRTGRSTRRKS